MKKILLLLAIASTFGVNAQSWISQATGFNDPSRGIDEIKIVNASIVWAKAYDGSPGGGGAQVQEFTRTINGGTTWSPGIINVNDSALGINNIAPISATTAWVSAVNPTDGSGSCIYKTSDAGLNWEQQNATGFVGAASFVNFVHFFDANNGFAAGDPINNEYEIYRSTDSGVNWTLVPGANIPAPLSGEYGYNGGNVVIGNTIWLPTNRGRIFKSTDQGLTWTVSQAPITDFGGTAQNGRLSFSDVNNGCLLKTVGTTFTYYTTTTGGATWSAGSTFTGDYRLLTYVPGSLTIVSTSQVAGLSGSAYSSNNGINWNDIDFGTQRGVSAFLNGSTGWCAGFSTNSTTDGIFRFDGTLSNATFETASAFSVYPNPASSTVSINSEVDSFDVSVSDLTGKIIFEKSMSGVENTVDVSSFNSGIYFFTLTSDSRKETVKIIKN